MFGHGTIETGLVDEVKRLVADQFLMGRTASQALGYREVIDWLQGRIGSFDEMRERIQSRTRQFAKRQHTWFRNLEECREVRTTGQETASVLCERIMELGLLDQTQPSH